MSYKDELFDLELRKQILKIEFYKIKIEFYKTKDEKRKKEIKALINEINRAKRTIEKQQSKAYKKAGLNFKF